jgi:hypothetical protein
MANGARDPGVSPDWAAHPAAEPCDVVLVGAGERAAAWLAPLRRSARLRLIATVARGSETLAPDLAHYTSLAEAMGAHPGAAFAVALPPRAGLEHALQLAAAGRAGVVEAPLHDALLDAELAPGAARLRVAHGWVTLAGRRAIEAVMRRTGAGRLHIEIAGLPEDGCADPYEGLVHAAALVRALLPQATVSAARHADDGMLEVELTAPGAGRGWSVQLRLRQRGRRLAVRVEGAAEAVWSWEDDREGVTLGNRALVAPRATPPAAVRALAQLLPDAAPGDGLLEAAGALRLARSCLALLPTRLPLGARAFRQSASIARRRPLDVLGRLGLRGALAADQATPPVAAAPALPPEPFELWAFRAGVKPVVFLTVRPDEVERTLSYFGDVHCERRERRVHIEAQDRWSDRRDQGEARVELYIARDAQPAQRMAELQAEADPSAALRELGALAGYPACCIDAFARQDDRANNSRNRYCSQARTLRSDRTTPLPWPWELNNLHTMTVPFYPCSYRCAAALEWARSALAELARQHPATAAALRAFLARPVLYFDHDHQLVLDGKASDGEITYRSVTLPLPASPPFAALAGAIGQGDRLSLDDRQLLVRGTGRVLLRLDRTDPGLGFVAPFGALP